jgi:hypothetical protein
MVFRLLVQVACVQEPGKMILRLSLAGSRVGNETLGRSGKSAGYRIAIGAYSEAIDSGPMIPISITVSGPQSFYGLQS